MGKKYKFRKIFINCINGQSLQKDVLSSSFYSSKEYATSILKQSGYFDGYIEKRTGFSNKTEKHTVEGFFLVPEKLYQEILMPYIDTSPVLKREEVFVNKLKALLSGNNTWLEHQIIANDIISVVGDSIWINLDALPNKYQIKFISGNFSQYVNSFIEIARSAAAKDVHYYLNFIYRKKQHPMTVKLK